MALHCQASVLLLLLSATTRCSSSVVNETNSSTYPSEYLLDVDYIDNDNNPLSDFDPNAGLNLDMEAGSSSADAADVSSGKATKESSEAGSSIAGAADVSSGNGKEGSSEAGSSIVDAADVSSGNASEETSEAGSSNVDATDASSGNASEGSSEANSGESAGVSSGEAAGGSSEVGNSSDSKSAVISESGSISNSGSTEDGNSSEISVEGVVSGQSGSETNDGTVSFVDCTTVAPPKTALFTKTAAEGSLCVFGVDSRDEGGHCIIDDLTTHGSFGWCYTNGDKSEWGSCIATCPLFGQAAQLERKMQDQQAVIDAYAQKLAEEKAAATSEALSVTTAAANVSLTIVSSRSIPVPVTVPKEVPSQSGSSDLLRAARSPMSHNADQAAAFALPQALAVKASPHSGMAKRVMRAKTMQQPIVRKELAQ